MGSRIKPGGGIYQLDSTIREPGRTTKMNIVQGLDLVVEQKRKGHDTAHLWHYSNPGTAFFTGLLKFLYVSKAEIPEVLPPNQIGHDEFRIGAKIVGMDFAHATFPIRYQYYHDMQGVSPIATLQIKIGEKPELYVTNHEGHDMIISIEAAQKMLKVIPAMYPGFDSFHVAYLEFLEQSRTKQLATELRI